MIFVINMFHLYICIYNFICIIVKKGPTFHFVRKDAQEAGFCDREGRGDMTKYYFFFKIFFLYIYAFSILNV